eukprot:1151036-Pelagomonas_calceolata.AAC.7
MSEHRHQVGVELDDSSCSAAESLDFKRQQTTHSLLRPLHEHHEQSSRPQEILLHQNTSKPAIKS